MKIPRRHALPALIACALLLVPGGAALAQQNYNVVIRGAPNGFEEKLELISDLKKSARNYPTSAALRRAARRDQEAFDQALQSAGYYAGEVEFELQPAAEEGGNATVVFNIDPGPAFAISEYEIIYRDDERGRPATLEDADIEPEGSAAGADLRDLQVRFLNHLWESGYPQAKIVARRAIADMTAGAAYAVFVFESGPKAHFGEIRIDGVERTDESFVRKLRTWEPGAEYERSKMVAYRDRLAETGLFSAIEVEPGAPGEDGAAPIIVKLEERKPRTIGAGASYSTSEGPGGRIFFEHRNILDRGETLRIELAGSQIEQSINFDVNKPLPGLPGQAFANFAFINETTDAFDARSVTLSGGLAKGWLDDRLETRGALALETSNVKENGAEERSYLVSLPLSVTWDTENDILNPTEGVRARWAVTPYTGTDTFTQSEIAARSRLTFGENDRFTLAGRTKFGATFGDSLDSLPRNKRYFAGGGSSVRGYGFQEAGPLDADGDPLGGRSLIEGAFEARVKITEKIQLAAFVDAGSVSQSNLPNFSDEFFIGYGAGARYFTPIGPIRLDVAFPADARVTDRDFQIYIAIGQPF